MNKSIKQTEWSQTLKPAAAAVALLASSWAFAGTAPTSRAGTEYVPPTLSADTVVSKTKALTAKAVDELKEAGQSMEAAHTGFATPHVSRAGVEYVPPKLGLSDVRSSVKESVAGLTGGSNGAGSDDDGISRAGAEYDAPAVSPEAAVDAVADAATDTYHEAKEEVQAIFAKQGSLATPTVSRMGVEYAPPRYESLNAMTSSLDLMDSRS